MSKAKDSAGFTLIELLIVLALISILAAMGVVQYKNGVLHTQESVLRTDLFRMRDAIDQYYADKNKYPAQDPRGSDHALGGYLADRRGRARPEQSGGRARDLRRQKRRPGHGPGRNHVCRLVKGD